MDAVFRALADPTRRKLLDALFRADGQTLGALEERFAMTRFGVMKHLKQLEAAGLVVTRRRGREKLHFLNPVPIRLVHDRWVSKYTEPWAAALSGLKQQLEAKTMEKIFEIYIKTTPQRLWKAITDPAETALYYYHTKVQSDWKPGSRMVYLDGDEISLECKVLEIDPPNRLVHSFSAMFDPQLATERPSRVTWTIEQQGETCHLTVVHDDFDGETGTFREVQGGWPLILSGLKTLIETGQPLHIGQAAEVPA